MAKLILTVFVILCVNTECICANRKQLEKRLAIIEGRQDDLGAALRGDMYDIGQRLDNIETHINTSLEELIAQQSGVATDTSFSDKPLTNEVRMISQALADEKSRWRREASAMEVSVEGLKQEIGSIESTVEKIEDGCKTNSQDTLDKVVTESHKLEASLDVVQGDIQAKLEHSARSVDALKIYVDRSIEGLRDEIFKALKDLKCNCAQTVAPTTEPPTTTSTTTRTTSTIQVPSCLEHYNNGERQSRVYTIYPEGLPVQVYCDMTTDGGGWTVFQRRKDGSVDFFRTWDEYASGFGNVTGEYWLGNDAISTLTSNGSHELRIDMVDFDGNSAYAEYSSFRVSPSVDNYTLNVSGFTGDAGDSLAYHNGSAFSTRDQDNDIWFNSCAQYYSGAWWYSKGCSYSNLNGPYGRGHGIDGVWWYFWKRIAAPLKRTEMKFRARSQV